MPAGSQGGISNNPSGRSSDVARAAQRAMSALADACTEDRMRRMASAIARKAAKGDPIAVHLVLDRLVGKPKQVFEGAINGSFKAYIGFNPDDSSDGRPDTTDP